ncbi:M20/M25/M40 family metallo-hydrolase [Altererythrobacter sp.]|uniref:M20/M25/M40 family metallo-hydrolase n=1 Tax=Altererythrobacter sp. TaxID=1872480 RepID=UPI003CFE28E3
MRRILTLLVALAFSVPASAQLSAPEQVMVETVADGFESDVALLERIVSQNSGTHNHEGVRAVAHILIPEFEALGFTVEWIDQSAAGRAGHLFARHEGKPGSTRMLLIGHMDTVFEPDSGFDTFTREGDRAIGPGVEDDKGGVIVILSALRAMKAAGTLKDASIVVALTGDEEDAGSPLEVARADLRKAGEWADVALGFEGLSVIDGKDFGVVARRSSSGWELTTRGKTGHSSGIFDENAGYGAIYEMARILDTFRRELPEENLTFNVGLMVGGTPASLADDGLSGTASGKTNIIPPVAIARGDLRTISSEQTDRTIAAMQAIVDANLPGTDAEIEFDIRYPPMSPTEGNRALLARLNRINADMGLEKMEEFPPSKRGAADISFVAELVQASLAGLGPSGELGHAPGESVDLRSFTRQAQRAAILMSRLAAETPKRD